MLGFHDIHDSILWVEYCCTLVRRVAVLWSFPSCLGLPCFELYEVFILKRVCCLFSSFTAKLLAWIASRVLSARVSFRLAGFQRLKDVSIQFRKVNIAMSFWISFRLSYDHYNSLESLDELHEVLITNHYYMRRGQLRLWPLGKCVSVFESSFQRYYEISNFSSLFRMWRLSCKRVWEQLRKGQKNPEALEILSPSAESGSWPPS